VPKLLCECMRMQCVVSGERLVRGGCGFESPPGGVGGCMHWQPSARAGAPAVPPTWLRGCMDDQALQELALGQVHQRHALGIAADHRQAGQHAVRLGHLLCAEREGREGRRRRKLLGLQI